MSIITTEMPVEAAPGANQDGEPAKTVTGPAAGNTPAVDTPATPAITEPTTPEEEDEDDYEIGSKKGEVPRGIRKKFGKLTSEVQFLREQLAEANKRTSPAPAPAVTEKTDEEPTPEDFESYVDYMSARAEWKAEQKINERFALDRQEKEQALAHDAFMKKVQVFQAEISDFNETIQSVPKDIQPSREFQEAIATHELGALVGYTLAKDHDNLRRIMALPPVLQVLEFAEVAATLKAERDPASKKKQNRPAVTPPPAPAETLDKGTTAKTVTLKDVENDYMAWKKLRAQQKASR